MTTATRTRARKTSALAGLEEREAAWQSAKAEADRLGREFGEKSRQAQALADERRRLIHHEPGLVDHHGHPLDKSNLVGQVDAQVEQLGDLQDLHARMLHARQLEERAKQAAGDYIAANLDAILAGLEPQADAAVAAVVSCMADLHEAAAAYLNLARRVDGLKATDRDRRHQRVPAIDTASDLLRLSRDYVAPPSPVEIR